LKKILDNLEDLSVESSFNLLTDFLKRVGAGIIIGIAMAILFGWASYNISFLKELFDRYEYVSYDSRIRYKVGDISGEMAIDDVVIIDIETSSVAPTEEGGLGRYFNWPHSYHGQLINTVSSGNPKAILFDMIVDPENTFNYDLVNALQSENKPNQALDEVTQQYLVSNDPSRFVEATFNTQKAYHGLEFGYADTMNFLYPMDSEPEGYYYDNHIIKGVSEEAKKRLPPGERFNNTHVDLLSASVGAGSVTFLVDEDGVIRRAPTAIYFEGADHVYPSLVLSGIIDILGIKKDGGFDYDFENNVLNLIDTTETIVRSIPIDDRGRMFVNFYGGFQTFTYIPYMYAMDPEMLDPTYWENKVGIVGASLAGLSDFRNTPVAEAFVGVEIHANAMYSILQNEFIKIKSQADKFKTILILSVLMGIFISFPKKPLYALPIPIIGIVSWIIFTRIQFGGSLIMWDVTRTILSMIGTFVGIFMYNYFGAEKDKRFLKNTFSTYISPELIDQMYDAKEQPSLGGEEGYHTAFFTDIQSFSAFSEKLTASDLVELLNDYLTEMTDILLSNKGTLDKYIGDAIVAFYGAPAPVDDHEYWSCLTAVKMQERLAELREKWQEEGDRWPEIVHNMQNRIGINTGKLVTGNMGSTMRMNYTMMGDTVNLAARLEASAKQYGIYIQVAEETYAACKDKFIWRDLDYVIVMGKTEPAQVFELISEEQNMPPGYDKLLPAYNEALKLYRNQDWVKAIDAFKASDELEDMFPGRKTNPSKIYIPRCEHYRDNPPGDEWDGSWALTKK
tara:strand:- start:6253 stop:8622 length:2370 start_codon:yes stop_codon:yes gene_type:complete